MIGAYGTLVAVVAASVAVGLALLSFAGRREASWHAAPLGFAALLVTAGIAANAAPGVALVAVAVGVLVAASVVVVVVRRPAGLGRFLAAGLPAALLAVVVASLPFIATGRVGILGVGLVNDDMASHLLISSWLAEGFIPEPVLINQGYPLGPHALVAGLADVLHARQIDAFAGLTLALPAVTAVLAFGALDRLSYAWRTTAAAAVALPYLVAAYVAQEAFKEPAMALFLLAFALWLSNVRRPADAVPLGVLAAGTLYVYSFPGLAWLVGTAVLWGAVELLRGRRPAAGVVRGLVLPAAVAAGGALVLAVPDVDRLRDFTDFRALDADRANEGGLGNLRGHISPLEALGIWPTSEFRLSAGAGRLPAAAFYAGAALALLALAFATPRWIRRQGWAIPAALATALAVYAGARLFGTVYTSAKALAVLAPLVTLITLGGLLGKGNERGEGVSRPEDIVRGRRRMRRRGRGPSDGRDAASPLLAAFAVSVVAGMALSSFLVLRQAPVGPEDHMEELAELRPLVEGERVLFLGRDNFVLYSLRGSRPFTHVRNFYDPYFVEPNFDIERVASKFDFDAVEAEKLSRFPYVITTRAAYGSGPPPHYQAEHITDSYILWRAAGSAGSRRPVETGPQPTGELRCRPRERSAFGATGPGKTVSAQASAWAPSSTIEHDAPASVGMRLSPGEWHLSLQYDAMRPVRLSAPGFAAELPANLDYRGTAPFWPADTIEIERTTIVPIEASVQDPPGAGALLRASSVAHLGDIVATRASGGYARVEEPYPGAGERLGRLACGQEADWVSR